MSNDVKIVHYISWEGFYKDYIDSLPTDTILRPIQHKPIGTYKEWMDEYCEMNKLPITYKEYFMVISHNPVVSTKKEWFDRLIKYVLSSGLHKKMQLSIEHIDSNIHCNAYVSVLHNNIAHKKYKTWYKHKYGNIHVQGPIKSDRGITNYIQKENPIFENLKDFIEYYGPRIP